MELEKTSGIPNVESDVISEELNPVTLKVATNDIHLYYSESTIPDVRDLVIYIRSKYPNPWQKVIIDTDLKVPVKYLENMFIYVKGINEDEVKEIRGLGSNCYCLVHVSESDRVFEDCGLREKLAEFSTTYNVSQFEVLVYGDDKDALRDTWEYIQNHGDIYYNIYFPAAFTNSLKLFKNGLDIAPYAQRLMKAAAKNEITSDFLKSIMDELRSEVENGKVAIQDFEGTRSIYAKWLSMCLIQEYSLPPVYLSSYIAEYVGMKIAYPFEKLSFYERVKFMQGLPETVGYIGPNQEFRCIFSIKKKIYPNPAVAFDMISGEVLTEDLDEKFSLDRLKIIDYRAMFKQSEGYFVNNSAGMVSKNDSDAETDRKLVELFDRMTEAASTVVPDIYMSVRNTVLAQVDGRNCIIYYTEPFGVWGVMQSEYFGAHPYAVYEDEFHRLIDIKVILADRERQNTVNVSEGNQKFQQIMLVADSTFKPAIPTFLLMCSELSRYLTTDMSYYDKRLRCDRNVVPIVTHMDSKLCDNSTVFNYVDLLNLRKDPVAKNVISAFGTLNFDAGSEFLSKIPVSIETFRGCSLL